jgi:hypothetical protein
VAYATSDIRVDSYTIQSTTAINHSGIALIWEISRAGVSTIETLDKQPEVDGIPMVSTIVLVIALAGGL